VCLWIASLVGFRITIPAEIIQVCAGLGGAAWQRSWCGLVVWQALGAQSSRDHVGLRGRNLGDRGLGGAEEWAKGSEIPRPAEQWLCSPMGRGLACIAGCSFSKSRCGEAFLELGVQSADVSALPGALPQPSVSPVSQQSP
jgi:hypothetical protein